MAGSRIPHTAPREIERHPAATPRGALCITIGGRYRTCRQASGSPRGLAARTTATTTRWSLRRHGAGACQLVCRRCGVCTTTTTGGTRALPCAIASASWSGAKRSHRPHSIPRSTWVSAEFSPLSSSLVVCIHTASAASSLSVVLRSSAVEPPMTCWPVRCCGSDTESVVVFMVMGLPHDATFNRVRDTSRAMGAWSTMDGSVAEEQYLRTFAALQSAGVTGRHRRHCVWSLPADFSCSIDSARTIRIHRYRSG